MLARKFTIIKQNDDVCVTEACTVAGMAFFCSSYEKPFPKAHFFVFSRKNHFIDGPNCGSLPGSYLPNKLRIRAIPPLGGAVSEADTTASENRTLQPINDKISLFRISSNFHVEAGLPIMRFQRGNRVGESSMS